MWVSLADCLVWSFVTSKQILKRKEISVVTNGFSCSSFRSSYRGEKEITHTNHSFKGESRNANRTFSRVFQLRLPFPEDSTLLPSHSFHVTEHLVNCPVWAYIAITSRKLSLMWQKVNFLSLFSHFNDHVSKERKTSRETGSYIRSSKKVFKHEENIFLETHACIFCVIHV